MGIRAVRYALYGLVVLAAIAVGLGVRFLVQETAEPIPHSVETPKKGPGPAVSPDVPKKNEEPAPAPSANNSGAVEAPKAETALPSFDVVRVEPDGQAVVAGRVAPSSEVELLENGRVLDRATANEAGEVVFTPPALGVGNHDLTLRARSADGTVLLSKQSVLVRVPQKGQGDLLVVAGEAGKPSKVLQAGPSALKKPVKTAAAEAKPEPEVEITKAVAEPQPLRIAAVETGDGRLFVQGSGPAGAKLAIYLNDTQLAEATVGADGHWTLTVEKGLAPGNYKIRADQLDADRSVTARAEVPFVYTAEAVASAKPAEPAAAAAPEAKAEEQQTAQAGSAASPQPETSQPEASEPSAARRSEEAQATAPRAAPSEETASGEAATSGTAPSGEASSEKSLSGNAAPEQAPPQQSAPEVASAEGSSAAASGKSAEEAAPAAAADKANPVVATIDTVSVKKGDCLWRISRSVYGEGIRYTVIYQANQDQIRDPDLIYPGQIFVLPSRG